MYSVSLDWKEFSVNLDKVNKHLKVTLSSNYDGMLCDENSAQVMFFDTCSEEDLALINSYWDGLTSSSFDPSMSEIVLSKIEQAQVFGDQLMRDFAVENVLAGITQAGKTTVVTNYLHKLSHYIMTGSLYAAISEIDAIIADTSDAKTSVSPFVTNDRMTSYKNKVQDYLGIPRT